MAISPGQRTVTAAFDLYTRDDDAMPIHFNAPPEVTIDLVIPALDDGLSIFERYANEINRSLEGQNVTWADLTEPDIDFIAGDTGIERQHLAWLVAAARQAGASKPDSANVAVKVAVKGVPRQGIPVTAYYAWFCAFPTDPNKLFKRSRQELLESLSKAITDRIIPRVPPEWLENIGAALDIRRQEIALQPAIKGAPASVGDLLNTVSPKWLNGKRAKVAELLDRCDHTSADFADEAKGLKVCPTRK